MLIPKENEENLFTYQKSWLRVLYNNMSASFEEFGKNALSIITYNYDRSVEHFFLSRRCKTLMAVILTIAALF